jgi:hypothetical protein
MSLQQKLNVVVVTAASHESAMKKYLPTHPMKLPHAQMTTIMIHAYHWWSHL